MRQITSTIEYNEFVELLVRRRNERDPSPPEFVANHVVQDWKEVVDGGYAPMTSATPYLDYRVAPCSIIKHSPNSSAETVSKEGVRRAAVLALTQDLEQEL